MTMDIARRERLDADREGLTCKVSMGQQPLYVTANSYPDGRLAEVFMRGSGKEGSTMEGMVNHFCICFSIALQYGAPMEELCRKFHPAITRTAARAGRRGVTRGGREGSPRRRRPGPRRP